MIVNQRVKIGISRLGYFLTTLHKLDYLWRNVPILMRYHRLIKLLMQAYFSNIESKITQSLNSSLFDIKIAVAWFNNQNLFNILIKKLPKVKIELIISNDSNNYENGINFQEFIDKGGYLYLPNDQKLMHNKYLIIDNTTILTGSYNFTYGAENLNNENLIIIHESDSILNSYNADFKRLTENSNVIDQYNKSVNTHQDFLDNLVNLQIDKIISTGESSDDEAVVNLIMNLYNQGESDTKGVKLIKSIESRLLKSENKKMIFAACLVRVHFKSTRKKLHCITHDFFPYHYDSSRTSCTG